MPSSFIWTLEMIFPMEYLLLLLSVGVVVMLWLIFLYWLNTFETNNSRDHKECNSAECFRCQYSLEKSHVFVQRINTFIIRKVESGKDYDLMGLQAIENAVKNQKVIQGALAGQKSCVFHMPAVTAKPVWELRDFSGVLSKFITKFRAQTEAVKDEFGQISKLYPEGWQANTVPTGQWSIFPIVNQGEVIETAANQCPCTMNLYREFRDKSLVPENVFATLCFSVLHGGSEIERHSGPTNTRLRMHLGLLTQKETFMEVNGEKVTWETGEIIIFDDSYMHSVSNRANGKRAVLIMDLWHPDVTSIQKEALNSIFKA